MFKKITALLLLTAFTNVYAVTPIQQTSAMASELNKTFDTLNYKLNVEWDQKDSQFFNSTIADFEKEIGDLQSDGVTNKDLIAYTSEKIKDKQIQNDINELSQIVADSQMTNDEARDFIVSKLNSTYSEGASWSGRRMGVHTAIIVGAIVLILICVHHPKKKRDNNNCYPQMGNNDYVSSNSGCQYAIAQ